jgi:hypothetical protein
MSDVLILNKLIINELIVFFQIPDWRPPIPTKSGRRFAPPLTVDPDKVWTSLRSSADRVSA